MIGTPLIKSLEASDGGESGPVNSRRSRLQEQEIVRDEQGRRRFHGAFTGGFSAGYHNTVDTIEGFSPKQFVSRRTDKRKSKRDGLSPPPSYSHKPEDYMDAEDHQEFGIAPKKMRLVNQGQLNTGNKGVDYPQQTVIARNDCLGEKILKRMCNTSNLDKFTKHLQLDVYEILPNKTDYHGLGYEPIKQRESHLIDQRIHDTLQATLSCGKRLVITGDAFGTGASDDDDNEHVSLSDIYGRDDMTNYDFGPRDRKDRTASKTLYKPASINLENPNALQNFTLAETFTTSVSGVHKEHYVPEYWVEPEIEFESVKSTEERSYLGKHFASSSGSSKSHDIETKSGLVQLKELKFADSKSDKKKNLSPSPDHVDTMEFIVHRDRVEWRPCSLLCKRFNVANPYPDNLFFGVKPTGSSADVFQQKEIQSSTEPSSGQSYVETTMEVKRAIFDQEWSDMSSSQSDDDCADNDATGNISHVDDDADPQVIQNLPDRARTPPLWLLGQSAPDASSSPDDIVIVVDKNISDETNHDNDECVIVPIEQKEPELIVLGDSSTSSSGSSTPKSTTTDHDSDSDAYGPPLPPTWDKTKR